MCLKVDAFLIHVPTELKIHPVNNSVGSSFFLVPLFHEGLINLLFLKHCEYFRKMFINLLPKVEFPNFSTQNEQSIKRAEKICEFFFFIEKINLPLDLNLLKKQFLNPCTLNCATGMNRSYRTRSFQKYALHLVLRYWAHAHPWLVNGH